MMQIMIMIQWRLWYNEDKLAWNRKKHSTPNTYKFTHS